MKETGIIMSGDHPRKILDLLKTQTRRTYGLEKINENPDLWIKATPVSHTDLWRFEGKDNELLIVKCPYGQVGSRLWCKQNYFILDEYLLGESDILYRLTDDRIYAILTMEVQDGRYKTDNWSPSQAYPNLPQRGLHGGVGWSNLLTNKIQRLWAEGIRGLVSASRTQQWQGLSEHLDVSSEPQGNSECSPLDMYGFSWDATIPVISDTAFRRQSGKQSTEQSEVGNAGRKLDGQKDTRTRERGGEAPDGEANELSDESSQVGNRNRVSEPEESSENTWDVAGWHLRSCPSAVLRLKPSIHMPRWASRITCEITEVRVERVQEITTEGCYAEGVSFKGDSIQPPRDAFEALWNFLNAKRGYGWDFNPWVWPISF